MNALLYRIVFKHYVYLIEGDLKEEVLLSAALLCLNMLWS